MRAYLNEANLRKALAVSAVATALCTPRIVLSPVPADLYIPLAFLVLTLLAGAVMAWGRCGGMVGAFPRGHRIWKWSLGAAVAGGALTPIYAYWLDPMLKQILTAAGNTSRLQLQCPNTFSACLAAALWVVGFQVLFYDAAAMSFFSRLTKRWPIALALAVALRIFVTHRQFSTIPVESVWPFHAMNCLASIGGCLFFARGGLPGATAFAFMLSLRRFC